MIRHEFSYWVKIKSSQMTPYKIAQLLEQELNDDCLLHPAGPLTVSSDQEYAYAEVNPDTGTTEETDSILSTITGMATMNPHLDIELKELDEEDKSVQRLYRFQNGKQVLERHARLVECTEAFDAVTLTATADWLSTHGQQGLAREMLTAFGAVTVITP